MATGSSQRRIELAQIHMAAAHLGMDTEDKNPASEYRSMLWTCARVHSAADLDFAGRRKVIDHLKARGWKPVRSKQSKHYDDKLTRKILALWLELRDQGVIQDASNKALAKFCNDVAGVARPEWCNNKQAEAVIEGLKAWLKRATTKRDGEARLSD